MTTKKEQILNAAVDILLASGKKGRQYSELMELLKLEFPEFPPNTIHGTAWRVHKETDEIKKIGRGHYIHKSFLSLEDMVGDGSLSLSDFLNRKEYNIIVEFLEEFKVDFDTIEMKDLCELNEEEHKKFKFLMDIYKYLPNT